MPTNPMLSPARELVATNAAHFPNESAEYRAARNELLAEEIEVRRHVERVAAQRRALPRGGEVPHDFEFASETGPIRLSSLFGDKDTLMVYSMMYGPARMAPCPSCTSFLSSWNGTAVNLRERSAIAVTARSPIGRLLDYKKQRGFANLPFVSDMSGNYTRTYVNADDADVPGFSVFIRRDGKIFHLLQRRNERRDGRPRPGSARRSRPRPTLADAGFDAGRPRHRLVSEAPIQPQVAGWLTSAEAATAIEFGAPHFSRRLGMVGAFDLSRRAPTSLSPELPTIFQDRLLLVTITHHRAQGHYCSCT